MVQMPKENINNLRAAPVKSLKDQNRWPLLLVMLLNAAVFYTATTTNSLLIGDIGSLIKGWEALLPAGAAFVFAGVLNELLNNETKARLVFWRWKNPLPGNQAFSIYASTDPRVDLHSLTRKCGPLPTEPREQNALWYRLYLSIRNDPAIVQVHRNYLFTRDYAAISALLLFALGIAGFWKIPSPKFAGLYLMLLVGQYLLVRGAAKNHGIRFVTTVLAIKAAE